jgi:N-methylhydantoinase B
LRLLASEEIIIAAWGILGGQPEIPDRFCLLNEQEREQALPSMGRGIRCKPITAAVIETSGAGGYGEPGHCSEQLLEEDREFGRFSRKFLLGAYDGKSA